jgi:hypothetical protein
MTLLYPRRDTSGATFRHEREFVAAIAAAGYRTHAIVAPAGMRVVERTLWMPHLGGERTRVSAKVFEHVDKLLLAQNGSVDRQLAFVHYTGESPTPVRRSRRALSFYFACIVL